MTIDELIEKLEEIEAKEGNIDVYVQYRDDGDSYSGGEEPWLIVREEEYRDGLEKEVVL